MYKLFTMATTLLSLNSLQWRSCDKKIHPQKFGGQDIEWCPQAPFNHFIWQNHIFPAKCLRIMPKKEESRYTDGLVSDLPKPRCWCWLSTLAAGCCHLGEAGGRLSNIYTLTPANTAASHQWEHSLNIFHHLL